MKGKVFAVPLLLACGLAAFFVLTPSSNQLRAYKVGAADWATYSQWLVRNGKEYADEWELLQRFGVFRANKHMIEAHNAQKLNFTLDVNNFADLTMQEFKERFLCKLTKAEKKPFVRSVSAVPESIDWTSKGAVTPIKNQGQCGSCWAFSSTGSLEGAYFQKTGNLLSFSEQQLVDCSGSYGNQGCNGGLMDSAFKYWMKYKAMKESDYPYHAQDGTCHYDASKGVTTISGYEDVDENEVALKSASAAHVVSVAVDAQWWQFYSSGVYSGYCGQSLDHGVLLVGYGASGSTQFWRIKNSWGRSWGESGFIRITRSEKSSSTGKCGVALSASYPTL